MSKISFVMPTKNRGKIIGESIDSIVKQTINEWELIVIDDHSDLNDITSSVIKEFNDSRIKYIKMPQKISGGIAEARNFGNMYATSSIIAVADSDDICYPDRASLTIEAFEKECCDVFYGQYEIFNKLTGELIARSIKNPAIKFSLEKLMEYNFIPHSSSAYKTSLIYEFPYNSFFRKAEDYDLFSRLAIAGKKFYFCDKTIFRYIIHDDNISKDKEGGNFGNIIKSNRDWSDFNRKKILSEILKKSNNL
jgi:glycosyltransferase involved in cell wall biosynthesis